MKQKWQKSASLCKLWCIILKSNFFISISTRKHLTRIALFICTLSMHLSKSYRRINGICLYSPRLISQSTTHIVIQSHYNYINMSYLLPTLPPTRACRYSVGRILNWHCHIILYSKLVLFQDWEESQAITDYNVSQHYCNLAVINSCRTCLNRSTLRS